MLSEKLRRLASLMQPDIQRMLERHAQRIAGNEGVRIDERGGTATYVGPAGVLWHPRCERVADFSSDLGLFRWWWHGVKFGEHARRRLDIIHREGEQYGMSELVADSLRLADAREADLLAQVGAQIARADGFIRATQGERAVYFALFDDQPRNERVFSVAPPAKHQMSSVRPGTSGRSLTPPPIAGNTPAIDVSTDDGFDVPPPPRMPSSMPPPPSLPVRDPAREIFMPLAQVALGDIAASVPGFGRAMLVVRVETTQGNKSRFFVQLVAVDGYGELVSLDPSRAVLDAAARMIADDARDGNGRWHKLVARLRPTERGASVDLEVA